jgi:hypothetical protein
MPMRNEVNTPRIKGPEKCILSGSCRRNCSIMMNIPIRKEHIVIASPTHPKIKRGLSDNDTKLLTASRIS